MRVPAHQREPDPDHVDVADPIEVRMLRLAWGMLLGLGILAALATPVMAIVYGTSPWPVMLGIVVTLLLARLMFRVAIRSALAREDGAEERAAREAGPSAAQQIMTVLHREGPTFPARFVAVLEQPLPDVQRSLKALARHGAVEERPDGRWVLGPKAPKV